MFVHVICCFCTYRLVGNIDQDNACKSSASFIAMRPDS